MRTYLTCHLRNWKIFSCVSRLIWKCIRNFSVDIQNRPIDYHFFWSFVNFKHHEVFQLIVVETLVWTSFKTLKCSTISFHNFRLLKSSLAKNMFFEPLIWLSLIHTWSRPWNSFSETRWFAQTATSLKRLGFIFVEKLFEANLSA